MFLFALLLALSTAQVLSVVRLPSIATQCLPSAGNAACTPVTTVAQVAPSNWTNLQGLRGGVPPAVSPLVNGSRPFTQWVLLSDWRFVGNGAVPGVSVAVGLRVSVNCLASGPGEQIPAGGVRLQTGRTTMFSRTTATPASARIPATR